MPSQYNPDKRNIGSLLSMTNPPIVVPEWQRNYSWSTTEVETFWQDLLTFDSMYPEDNILQQEYFLGSIVIVLNEKSHLLLDGQQRMATSAILLSVIRDFLHRYNSDAAVRTASRYLTDVDDATGENIYKITLNRYDRDFFRREISESRNPGYALPNPEIESHRKIRAAREYFVGKFDAKYNQIPDPQDAYQWCLRIQRVLTQHLSVVAITSADEDNAANVFETLNDRGIGLSTPDLLRNLVLRRSHTSKIDEIIDLWGEILSIESDVNIKNFIRHFWISLEGDVKTQSLYREIKANILNNDIESLQFTRKISDAASLYRDIATASSDSESIAEILGEIREIGATALYPVVLSVFRENDDNDQIEQILRALTNTYVRHSVIGGLENSQLENRIYSIAKSLRDDLDINGAIDSLKEFAPSDEQFKAAFRTASITRAATARYLLKKIEHQIRTTEELEVTGSKKVHLEHIYPQTPLPGARWPNHSFVINRIGNLTILSKRLNTQIKNANFPEKLPAYEESDLVVTNRITEYEIWNQQNVDDRQGHLADLAVEIWSMG